MEMVQGRSGVLQMNEPFLKVRFELFFGNLCFILDILLTSLELVVHLVLILGSLSREDDDTNENRT